MDVCIARCMERAKTSGRSDDKEETIKKRLVTYQEQSKPVVDMYERFGKVREVDGSGDQIEVFKATRQAMLPEVNWIMGPKSSGKTTIANKLASRTNAKLLKFNEFVKSQGLEKSDDETIVQALIQQLAKEISPRILIEDFPANTHQAKYFIKNAMSPSRVFVLSCCKDICQERMTQVPQSSPEYMPSALLSKSIANYNANLKDLLDFLRTKPEILSEVNTEQTLENSFKEVCAVVEPTIITVRSSGSDNAVESQKAIQQALSAQGYVLLPAQELIELEKERCTNLGQQLKAGDDASLSVEILKRIIYAGIQGRDKFLVCDFLDSANQAAPFEQSCAKIAAIIYTSPKGNTVETFTLDQESIETLFSKQYRLKTMFEWDASTFEEHLGRRTKWGVVTGRDFSGADQVAKDLCALTKGKVVSMKATSEEIKKSLGTEDEPFEGEVPLADVEKAIRAQVASDKAAGSSCTYIFDSWLHKSIGDFLEFANGSFGLPSFAVHCTCDKKSVEERFKKANETEEIGEDAAAELEDSNKKAERNNNEV